MRILVTGGAGFIGSYVVDELLKENHEVVVVDNLSSGKISNLHSNINKLKIFKLDLCSSELESAFDSKINTVIHLAAQISITKSIEDPVFDANVNILGTLNLLEQCRKHNVKKIVYTTSAAEIGVPEHFPIDEKHNLTPISPYGISKHTVDHYLEAYSQLYDLKYTILRYSNVYGPRQDFSGEGGVVAIFIYNLLKNKPIIIFGDGNQTRDFVFVEDVAKATVAALNLNRGNGEKYNVATGNETSINHLFNQIQSLLKLNPTAPQYLEPRKGEVSRSVFSIDKIKGDFGWKPEVTLKEGLSKTIAYIENETKNETD